MLETVISSLVSFVGTNIDDIFIDTLFFAEADTRVKTRSVVVGKYLGIGLLVLVGILGAFGVSFVPQQYIGFLGLIPIALGVKEIICNHRSINAEDNEEFGEANKKTDGYIWNVMLVTIANGADNIGVYIPLFAGFHLWQIAVMLIVYAIMIALWCFLGKKLSDLPFLRDFLIRYKHVIVPTVYIALGVYIIIKNIF